MVLAKASSRQAIPQGSHDLYLQIFIALKISKRRVLVWERPLVVAPNIRYLLDGSYIIRFKLGRG
jgi:hypothetical protein